MKSSRCTVTTIGDGEHFTQHGQNCRIAISFTRFVWKLDHFRVRLHWCESNIASRDHSETNFRITLSSTKIKGIITGEVEGDLPGGVSRPKRGKFKGELFHSLSRWTFIENPLMILCSHSNCLKQASTKINAKMGRQFGNFNGKVRENHFGSV